ncbi:MAG: hypothetical protein ABSH34_22500 [Verrucomicrobiota bacterium]|jgi:hypothetical protein
MKTPRDEAIAEVRTARKALCARFGNEPRRLLEYLRQRQRLYRGRVIKGWAEVGTASDPTDGAAGRPRSTRQ